MSYDIGSKGGIFLRKGVCTFILLLYNPQESHGTSRFYLHNLQTYMNSAQQIRVFWDVKHHHHHHHQAQRVTLDT